MQSINKFRSPCTEQLVDKNTVLEIFIPLKLNREATAYLLEESKGNREKQTKLLEINLMGGAPKVADAIMRYGIFTYFDFGHIARLCEQAGLLERAIEHYSDLVDVKGFLSSGASMLYPQYIMSYFESLSRDDSLEVMTDMMTNNMQGILNIVVQLATKYSDALGPECLIKFFEDFNSLEGMFNCLGAIRFLWSTASISR